EELKQVSRVIFYMNNFQRDFNKYYTPLITLVMSASIPTVIIVVFTILVGEFDSMHFTSDVIIGFKQLVYMLLLCLAPGMIATKRAAIQDRLHLQHIQPRDSDADDLLSRSLDLLSAYPEFNMSGFF
ncbi:unnamed protein product, partial [Meganyctiphanes norvegica]